MSQNRRDTRSIQEKAEKLVDIRHVMPWAGTLFTEGNGRFRLLIDKRRANLRANFEVPRADGRAKPGNKLRWINCHGAHQVFQNTTTEASPTRMGSANHLAQPVHENNRQAVCGEDGAGNARVASEAGVGIWAIAYVFRSELDDSGTVHLIQPSELTSANA